MKEYDFIILGAGISGLSFARLLQQHTDPLTGTSKTFLVLEKESYPGGLCSTHTEGDKYFDRGGGHFLYSKHKEVYDFIFSHLPEPEFNKFTRNTKIKLGDHYIDYPIEENLWQLPKDLQIKYLQSLIENLKLKINNDGSFADLIISKYGLELFNDYFKPYNEKLWGVPIDELSTDWLQKLPATDINKILKSIIYGKSDPDNMPSHQYFYYPKKGGFGAITEAIYEPVKEHVLLNTPVTTIDNGQLIMDNENCWIINGKYRAKNIINTLPWNALSGKDLLDDPFLTTLKNTSLVVSYHDNRPKIDYQWCYYPGILQSFHRKYNVGSYMESMKDFCMYETNLQRHEIYDKNSPSFEFEFINEFAYPIPLKNKETVISQILEKYNAINFYGLGRWGQWQHHNSDVCIFEAMKLFKKLIN